MKHYFIRPSVGMPDPTAAYTLESMESRPRVVQPGCLYGAVLHGALDIIRQHIGPNHPAELGDRRAFEVKATTHKEAVSAAWVAREMGGSGADWDEAQIAAHEALIGEPIPADQPQRGAVAEVVSMGILVKGYGLRLSTWNPGQNISEFKGALKELGPHVVKVCLQITLTHEVEVIGGHRAAKRDAVFPAKSLDVIVIFGVAEGMVLYADPRDPSDPGDSRRPLYAMRYETMAMGAVTIYGHQGPIELLRKQPFAITYSS